MTDKGMKFGSFLAPFHRLGENPTLAMNRDMELIEWMDFLGYDEVWVGEHHSAGWEPIAAPEIFIGAVAQRTKHIRLGSGVTSLPYHHPFLVAQRFVQLDHMTRGRTMLGCGPGALVSDAYMMGIEPITQRPRMDEALDAIMLLLKGDEPVTMKTDWFEMRQARLHLAPYTEPHFPIAVASVMTPSGVIAAGRHGLGVLSLGAGIPGGPEALANQWKLGEETAARHGKTMDRKNWKLVVNVHVAEMSKPSYATYVKDRLTGFGGSSHPLQYQDLVDFPGMARRVFGDPGRARRKTPACTGPIAVRDRGAAAADADNLKAALGGTPAEEGFLTAASPGVISLFFRDEYYGSHEKYLFAI